MNHTFSSIALAATIVTVSACSGPNVDAVSTLNRTATQPGQSKVSLQAPSQGLGYRLQGQVPSVTAFSGPFVSYSPSSPPPAPLPTITFDEFNFERPCSAFEAMRHDRHVRPRHDIRQSMSSIDRILQDGKPHSLTVLFRDQFKVRAHKSTRGGPSKEQFGRWKLEGGGPSNALRELREILQRHGVVSVSPIFVDGSQESEETACRVDATLRTTDDALLPDRASWVSLVLSDYGVANVRGLLKHLNSNPLVAVAEIAPHISPSSVKYNRFPAEPGFPRNWETNSIVNNETFANLDGSLPVPERSIECWWWNRHSVGEAWRYTKGGGVLTAVVDTCFDLDRSHNDGIRYETALARRFFTDNSQGLLFDSNVAPGPRELAPGQQCERLIHGTFVSSFLAASDTNGVGLCGVAPEARVIPVKAFSVDEIAAGIAYSANVGAEVINVSLGDDATNDLESIGVIRAAFDYARLKGCTVVYAAGNDRKNVNFNPDTFTGAICVGGIDKATNVYDIQSGTNASTYGSRVDIAAAAFRVTNTVNVVLDSGCNIVGQGIGYQTLDGTSYASPMVAATAAMVMNYTIDWRRVRDYVIFSSDISVPTLGNNVYQAGLPAPKYQGAISRPNDSVYVNREMSAGFNGNDGIAKVRVLNAGAAVMLAARFNSQRRYQVYRPGADDYSVIEQVETQGNSYRAVEGGFSTNLYHDTTGGAVRCWTFANGGWASSSSVFRDGRVINYRVYGAPKVVDPLSNLVQDLLWYTHPAVEVASGWVQTDGPYNMNLDNRVPWTEIAVRSVPGMAIPTARPAPTPPAPPPPPTSSPTLPPPTPSPTLPPTPSPTTIPTPVPTPRLARFYSATRWANEAGLDLRGAVSTISHVDLTAQNSATGGVAGEAMWLRGRPGNWVEVGYTAGPQTSSSIAGRCIYWANQNSYLGRYQDFKVMTDDDTATNRRSYRVQPRLVQLPTGFVSRFQVFVSDRNPNLGNWKAVGISSLVNEPITMTDHGLEVTDMARGTVAAGQQCTFSGIMHQIGLGGPWWNVDGVSYAVSNLTTAFPRFDVNHDLSDRRPGNNVTVNFEVP